MEEVGVPEKHKKKIRDHILKENGLKGSGVIGAYHVRRVAPLMTRALPLYAMAPEASFDGTTLAEGTLPNSRRRWSLCGTTRLLPLTSSTRCRGILRCGRSQAMSSS